MILKGADYVIDVISCRISLSVHGAWSAPVEIDSENVPVLGRASLVFTGADGVPVEFVGSIAERPDVSGPEGGTFLARSSVLLIGGAGRMGAEIPARDYAVASPALVARQIIEEAGELAGDLSGLEGAALLL